MTETPSDHERSHPEDPAEGATADQTEEVDTPRVHSEDPAEGADDESAVS